MQHRPFGRTSVTLSSLCLGAMRFDPKRISTSEAVRFLDEAYALGVDTWHSSSEYDTHAYFCEAMRAFRRARPSARLTHISKIAAPHFEDAAFDRATLRARIEQQLRDLGAERLDVVQWVARSKPVNDALRLPALEAMRDELAAEVEMLKGEGKVGAWAAFPYSTAWAAAFAKHAVCDGLVTYLNLAELDYSRDVGVRADLGHGFVAIRPLMAGLLGHAALDDKQRAQRDAIVKALASVGIGEGELTRFALRFPLLHSGVASVILVGSSRVDLQACKLEYSIVSPK